MVDYYTEALNKCYVYDRSNYQDTQLRKQKSRYSMGFSVGSVLYGKNKH